MKIIIPAAGIGKRLRPFTYIYPKPIMHIGHSNMINYILKQFENINVSKIDIIVGFLGKKIKETLGDKFNYIEQEQQKGLAHAVYMALEDNEEDILIWLSDTLTDIELKNNYQHNWIAVKQTDNPERFGVAFSENNTVKELKEKPNNIKSGDAIIGVYYFKNQKELKKAIQYIFENNIKTNNEYQLTDAIDYMLKDSIIKINRVNNWYDCGTFEDILSTHKRLMEIEGIYQKGNIKDSEIDKYTAVFNATIVNSKLENCIVYEDAYIENVHLYNSIIGKDSIVKDYNGKLIIADYSIINKEVK